MEKLNQTDQTVTHKSLVEIYRELPAKRIFAAKSEFVDRIAEVGRVSQHTAKMWLWGHQRPNILTRLAISEELGVPVQILFPEDENEK